MVDVVDVLVDVVDVVGVVELVVVEETMRSLGAVGEAGNPDPSDDEGMVGAITGWWEPAPEAVEAMAGTATPAKPRSGPPINVSG